MPTNVSFIMPEDQMALDRQQKLAAMLQAQAMQPIDSSQMVSGRVVPVGIGQGLMKLAQGYFAGQAQDKSQRMAGDIANKRAQARTQALESVGGGDRRQMAHAFLSSEDPMLQQMGMSILQQEFMPKKPVVVGRSLVDPDTGKVVATDTTWAQEQAAIRQTKAEEQERARAEREAARKEQADLRRELAANASADRKMIAGMVGARQEQKNVPKLPTAALKMQQDELDAIGTASSINADLAAIEGQIDTGKLKLGPVSNITAKAKNLLGASDEQSRNLASLEATLEKLRNDSLRLNKGVSTEGDAQRAWKELLDNVNDQEVAKQRLGEIQLINKRAANLRRMNVEAIRANFGVEPMDIQGYEKQQPAIGGGRSKIDYLLKKYGGQRG